MKKWVLIFLSILMMLVLAVPALAETGTAEAAQGAAHSAYTVEFTYKGRQYVMPGDSTIRLSEILDGVGLTGAVEAVEVSDERLFSASNETGEWIVTAHQVFSSMEWMKVTINGVAYEIAVTDDQEPVSYIDADGYTQTCETYTTLTANNTVWTGWVVAGSDVTISSRVMVSDEATLILCDGAVLTCAQGIDVGDHKLTVFVQSVGDGKLVANAPAQTTAIYGNVAICGGIIEAKGGIDPGNALGGDGIGGAGKQVLIGGGNVVTARGGEGQRGGRNQNGGDGGSGLRGTIVIQGLAYVNAYGGNGGHCGISNGTALNGGNGGDGITGDIKGYGAVNAVGGTGGDGSSGRVKGQDGTPGQAISGEHSNVTISPRKRCVQQIP